MYKALSLLLIAATLTACQTRPEDTDSKIVGVRCMLLAGKKPFDRENLRYIQDYAGYGSPLCKIALGKMYQEGGYGVDQDFRKARELFVESAKLSPEGNLLLGQMAERGEGEAVDYVKAREFYRLAGGAGAMALGRFLEEGKGGAQDRTAALALYMGQIRFYGDDAWRAMDRLRQQGVALSDAQANQFRQLWVKAFNQRMRSRLAVRELLEAVNAAGAERKATLDFRFKTGSGEPEITLAQNSGNAEVDGWIMKAASRITMSDPGPLVDESGVLMIKAPLVLTPQDASKARSMCRAEPCTLSD